VNKNNNASFFTKVTTTTDGYATFPIDKARPGDYQNTVTYVNKESYVWNDDYIDPVGMITKPK